MRCALNWTIRGRPINHGKVRASVLNAYEAAKAGAESRAYNKERQIHAQYRS
ncbi:MAG: hypothetical protein ACTXOO_01485 [Sodalis sp. (in: enterobacteria)]